MSDARLNGITMTAAQAFSPGRTTWKVPKDGKEFVGFLAGSRRDTRQEFAKILFERYGIRIVAHIGHEQRKELHPFIPSHVEIVVIIGDDIDDGQLQRVLRICKAQGMENIAIEYAKRKNPAAWDPVFVGNGYSSPLRFRDGGLIVNRADPKSLEEQRKAELAAIEETRPAWVDPALKKVTMGEVVKELAKYVPPPPEPKKEEPKKKAGPPIGKGGTKGKGGGDREWGALLRAKREELGISQKKACELLNTNQTNLSTYELGKVTPLYGGYLKLLMLFPDLPPPKNEMVGKWSYEEHGGLYHDDGTIEKIGEPGSLLAKLKGGKKPDAAPAPAVVEPAPAPAPAAAQAVAVAPPPSVVAAPLPSQRVEPAPAPVAAPAGEVTTIELKSGGTLSLTLNVNIMKLSRADRDYVFDVIDKLKAYEQEKKE